VDSTCSDNIEIDANADEVAQAIMAAQATVASVRDARKDWSLGSDDRSEVRAMSKANKKSAHRKDHHHQAAAAPDRSAAPDGAEAGPPKKMKRKKYEREIVAAQHTDTFLTRPIRSARSRAREAPSEGEERT
jgi:hypothetical protein